MPDGTSFQHCGICKRDLIPNPFYKKNAVKYCTNCGDYFLQSLRDKPMLLFFRPYGHPENEALIALGEVTVIPSDESPAMTWSYDPELYRQKMDDLKKKRATAGNVALVNRGNRSTAIRCNETGIIYASVRKACEELNLDRQTVFKHLRGDRHRSTVGGYSFTKMEEDF